MEEQRFNRRRKGKKEERKKEEKKNIEKIRFLPMASGKRQLAAHPWRISRASKQERRSVKFEQKQRSGLAGEE